MLDIKHKINILIVEDEIIIALDLKLFLQKNGYKVIKIVMSGEDVLKTVIEDKPDIILMDITLRGKVSGIEAAEQILPYNIPIIFTSAQQDESTISMATKVSPYFIQKPYSPEVLREMIEMALN